MNTYSGFLKVFLGLIFGFFALVFGIKYSIDSPGYATITLVVLFIVYKLARPFVDVDQTDQTVQTVATTRKKNIQESDEFDVWFDQNGR